MRFSAITILLVAFGLAWGLSQPGRAQVIPTYTPPVMQPNLPNPALFPYNSAQGPGYREGRGSYQLPDGSWHRANKLRFDGVTLVVKDSATGRQKFTPAGLRQFEVVRDTFLVVRQLPGRAIERPEFAESQLNQHGYQVWVLYANADEALLRPRYFLSRPGYSLQLLPTNKKDYRTAVAAIVADCPDLAREVAEGQLDRDQLAETIKRYLSCHRPAGAAK